MRFIKGFFILGRLGMAPLTISVPIFAGYCSSSGTPWWNFFFLGLIGLCAHIFGFGLNDIIDNPIDQTVAYRHKHPLTTGEIKQRDAWLFILVQPVIAVGIYKFILHGSLSGILVLIGSIFLSVIYNLWSKTGKFPKFIAEFSLALSIGLLGVAGSLEIDHMRMNGMAVTFSVCTALILLLLNSVPSGLKDLKTDFNYGATSFVISGGYSIAGENEIIPSRNIKIYSWVLEFFIGCVLMGMILTEKSPAVLVLITIVLFVYSCLHLALILRMRFYNTLLVSMPLLSGVYNYLALCFLAIPKFPIVVRLGIIGLGVQNPEQAAQ